METKKNRISLFAAILININIIIGAGVFLNVRPLIQISGKFSFFGYALGGLVLAPFVYILAKLAQKHPVSGGLYVYSKTYLNRFVGFLSGWFYFIGKTISAAFLAYAFTSFFQKNIIFLQSYSILLLTSIVILSLTLLNILGAQIGGKIQYIFLPTKIIPIFFVFIFGLLAIQTNSISNITQSFASIKSLISTIPIALYPLMGFEITCSIAHMIKKPTKNIFYAIVGSFLIVSIIYVVFQAILSNSIGAALLNNSEPLAILANKIFTNYPIVGKIITSLVFTSVISGSFGILTSNCWNFHTLAKNGHFFKQKFLCKISEKNIPTTSLIIQSFIACLIIAISKNQIALQSMSVFGVVVSFLLSSLAAIKALDKKLISICATLGCAYILFLCFQKIQIAGVSIPYLVLLFVGIGFGIIANKTNDKNKIPDL